VDGAGLLREALGEGVALVDYVKPGFKLAKAVAAAYDAHPNCRAMVWMRHGITTWAPTAREAYEAMIDLVTRAEDFAARRTTKAAAHQLARIASQEMADLGVRVNTVARLRFFRMERAGRACGLRSAPTACGRAAWMKRDSKITTDHGIC
jgi:rhamnose utilization protein RhaD (predicted bifunctional aldolase and dehydrogenase)